jgi:hypothetical protein
VERVWRTALHSVITGAERFSPGEHDRQGPSSGGQRLLLGSSVPEQLEQVVRRGDQVPFRIHLLQTPQQEAASAPGFLDLAIHRLHDRLALGVDP